jgi:hypothetical protein
MHRRAKRGLLALVILTYGLTFTNVSLKLRTATLAVAATLPAIPKTLRGTPTAHVARKTLTMGAS